MFRRKSESDATATVEEPKPGGKGRPTPTRKEAEAARLARVRQPRTRKEQAAARARNSEKIRQAMKTGDDRYLPTRDKGPVRRFVRDYVDTKFTIAELLIPVLVVTMLFGWSGNARLAGFANLLILLVALATVVSMAWLRFGLHKQLKRRFPEASRKGLTYYAIVRAMQLRFLRLPKSQVKIGADLPESDYRS
ncbi:DUF3043 domain-containing protein [Nocardioides sp.]|uniref:DUF3043 domain-containing protein n=1 Tax=Nocardioides sp. TaxID=35761 RepID=UPI0039E6D3FB